MADGRTGRSAFDQQEGSERMPALARYTACRTGSMWQRLAGWRIQSDTTGLINVVVIGAKPHARYSARAAAL